MERDGDLLNPDPEVYKQAMEGSVEDKFYTFFLKQQVLHI